MKERIFSTLPLQTAERKFLAALILVCLALVTLAISFELRARDRALQAAQLSGRNVVVSVLDHVNELFHQADVLLGIVQWRLDAAGGRTDLLADFRGTILHRVNAQPAVHDVYVYDNAGRLVLSSYEHHLYEATVYRRDFFGHHRNSLRDDLYIGRPYRTAPHRDWVIPVSRRLVGSDNSFAGVGVVALSLKHLAEQFSKFDLGPNGLLALSTRESLLLARYPFVEGAIGADLRDSSLHRNHYSHARSGAFIETSPIDGLERQYSFDHSTAYPVRVTVAMTKSHVLAPWQQDAVRTGILVGVLLLLLAIAGGRTLRALEREQRLMRDLQASNRRLADLERAVNEHAAVAITDMQGRVLFVNKQFGLRCQYAPQELIANNLRLLRSDRHPSCFFEQMWHTISRGGVWKGEIENRAKDGSSYWTATTIVPFLDETGQPYQYISICTDITERKRTEQELSLLNDTLAQLATRDELTGLANRRRFNEVLDVEFKRAQRSDAALSVLIFDVDFFKRFNDAYGHPAGDACLQRLAVVAQSACRRPGDLVCRWGGEEFVVLLPDTEAQGAMTVAQRLRDEVQALAIEHGGSPHRSVTVSIGVHCSAPAPGNENPAELLQCADLALYEAKKAGRNQVVLYQVPAHPMSASRVDCPARGLA